MFDVIIYRISRGVDPDKASRPQSPGAPGTDTITAPGEKILFIGKNPVARIGFGHPDIYSPGNGSISINRMDLAVICIDLDILVVLQVFPFQ